MTFLFGFAPCDRGDGGERSHLEEIIRSREKQDGRVPIGCGSIPKPVSAELGQVLFVTQNASLLPNREC